MKRSSERILTTHTGSLPRPPALREALERQNRGELTGADHEALPGLVADAVAEIVARQRAVGVDVVNDGEMGKVSYATYVTERIGGFDGVGHAPTNSDFKDFPAWAESLGVDVGAMLTSPACSGDLAYVDRSAIDVDVANLTAAVAAASAEEAFMTAASPGVVSLFLENQHYPSHEAYLEALADALKIEYDAIHAAGLLLQLDCPDLAAGRHVQFPELTMEEWRRTIELHVEMLNHATRDIPPEAMRLHLCWGNYEGPHHHDVPLSEIIDIVWKARPAGVCFEAANPRHMHEWRVFEGAPVPDGKVLIPGLLDSTTNYIEHPELIADRIVCFAELAGRENVIAGTDCGFATLVSHIVVHPDIAWAKFEALREGAALASERLWA